ncbi:MAG: folylpolyglutamate synthase/dihydrofolate synthase family protein [Candidatus Saccharimonadales bacterium]
MDITSFSQVHRIIGQYVPVARSMRDAYTLQNMDALMEKLGNPQDAVKVIHVAGTSGKTSTAYYMASLLNQAGCKVGLTVSPHISEVNERVQINLDPLSEAVFCREFTVFIKLLNQTNIKPTYFELLVAFAYWEFARQQVDYAVVEVGLGGLLDATNVVHRADKLCIITDIGLDHTDVLGNTVGAISAQKAGIIKPSNTVFTYEQNDEIMNVIRDVSDQQQATLHEVWPLKPSQLPKQLVLFQRRNWYLSLMTYDYLSKKDGLLELQEKQLEASTQISIPGRMETITMGQKTVIMDGAHNAQKMEAFARSVKFKYHRPPTAILLSLVQSKNFKMRTSLEQLIGLADHIIITSFETEQDMRKKSVRPIKIAEHCIDLGFDKITIISDPKMAFQALLDRPEKLLLVTGSFYLLNHIRPLLSAGIA